MMFNVARPLSDPMNNQDLGLLNGLKPPVGHAENLVVSEKLLSLRLRGRDQVVETQSYLPKGDRLNGPPIFIVPGAAYGASSHELLARHLALKGIEVHSMSLPGAGKSWENKHNPLKGFTGPSFGNLTRCVSDTFDALGLKRAVWLPHSMSGGKVMQIARGDPDKIAGAVFHSSISDKGTLYANWSVLSSFPVKYFEVNLRRDLRPIYASRAMGKRFYFSKSATTKETEPFIQRAGNYPYRAYAKTLFMPGFMKPEVFAEKKIPTLVLTGSEDLIFPVSHAKRIADKSGGTLVEFKRSSHNIAMDLELLGLVDQIADWYKSQNKKF